MYERPDHARLWALLEAAVRKGTAKTELRHRLYDAGHPVDEVHRFEMALRRTIRAEKEAAR